MFETLAGIEGLKAKINHKLNKRGQEFKIKRDREQWRLISGNMDYLVCGSIKDVYNWLDGFNKGLELNHGNNKERG